MSVGGCLCALWAQGWGIYILLFVNFYWIYTANNRGIYVSWRVSVQPLGSGLGNVQFVIKTILFDIYCQQLGDICQLGGVCTYFLGILNLSFCASVFVLGLAICLYLLIRCALMRMNSINSKKINFVDQHIVILDSYFSFLRMDKTKWDEQL